MRLTISIRKPNCYGGHSYFSYFNYSSFFFIGSFMHPQVWCLNRILDRRTWDRMNQILIHQEILKTKWSWIGFALRRPSSSLAWQVLGWQSKGKNIIGWPKKTWKGCMEGGWNECHWSLSLFETMEVAPNLIHCHEMVAFLIFLMTCGLTSRDDYIYWLEEKKSDLFLITRVTFFLF